jgi:hypothetical protein
MANELEAMKLNTLWLAEHHRKICDGESCNISLIVLMQMAEKAGITFTENEKMIFI